MKRNFSLAFLVAIIATIALAAPTSDRLKDTVLVGQGTATTKKITFDVGAGANNPFIYGGANGYTQIGLRLGVGTSAPTADIQVNSAAAGTPSVIGTTNGDLSKYSSMYSGESINDPGFFWNTGSGLRFGSAASITGSGFTEYMRIASNGNVGIGTASVNNSLNLEVTGNAVHPDGIISATSSNADTFASLSSGSAAGSDKPFLYWSSNADLRLGTATNPQGSSMSELARFTATGRLGVGATGPTANIQTNSTSTASSAVVGAANSDVSHYASIYSGDSANNPATIWNTGSSMRFGTASSISGASFSELVKITNGGGLVINAAGGNGGNIPHACSTALNTAAGANSVTVSCGANRMATGGGSGCGAGANGNVTDSRPFPTTGTPTGWTTVCSSSAGTASAYAVCCDY